MPACVRGTDCTDCGGPLELMGGDDDAAGSTEPLGDWDDDEWFDDDSEEWWDDDYDFGKDWDGFEDDESGALGIISVSNRQREQAPHDAGAARRGARGAGFFRGPPCIPRRGVGGRAAGLRLRDDAARRRGAQGEPARWRQVQGGPGISIRRPHPSSPSSAANPAARAIFAQNPVPIRRARPTRPASILPRLTGRTWPSGLGWGWGVSACLAN